MPCKPDSAKQWPEIGHFTLPAGKMAMLRKWLGAKATYKRLCQALTNGKRTYLRNGQAAFDRKYSSSDEEGGYSLPTLNTVQMEMCNH